MIDTSLRDYYGELNDLHANQVGKNIEAIVCRISVLGMKFWFSIANCKSNPSIY